MKNWWRCVNLLALSGLVVAGWVAIRAPMPWSVKAVICLALAYRAVVVDIGDVVVGRPWWESGS